ncbi:type II/IV secretion system protein [Pelagibacterales bacterium SAG-MED47]|nr:type II/IV secretion system protein [Pelagibacterales bacterium SAG-MED47]
MIRLDSTSEQSIINMLRDHNDLSMQQIKQIETLSKESGKSQIETAFELNITNDTKVAQLLSDSFSIPLVNLNEIKLNDDLKKYTEIRFLKENYIIPFEVDTKSIKVAIADASKFSLIKNIQSLTNLQPELYAASINQISGFIARLEQGAPAKSKNQKIEQVKKKQANVPLEVESDVIAFVDKILNKAIKLESSDIHIEPFKDSAHVRFRVDGVLRVMDEFTDFLNKDPLNYNSVVTRIKIISKLDIAERRIPQDGGSNFKYGDKEMDLRISIMPTKNNERIVMRLLNKEAGDVSLNQLGFADQDLKVLEEAINSPQGMVLVTGPTGSGKTTTLYSILKTINKPSMNILTAEDPVEYELEGVGQVQVREDIGYTFETALRSFLRQDPEVILVGEIRDKATVDIALKAALTGHLVFSTLHTNDAPSTITRLQNMGTPDYLISAACTLVMAQRLARKTCQECRVPDERINPKTLTSIGFTAEEASRVRPVIGKGCSACASGDSGVGNGYKGRMGIYEILKVSKNIKDAILRQATTLELKQVAKQDNFRTMQDMGRELIHTGDLSFSEFQRVLSLD